MKIFELDDKKRIIKNLIAINIAYVLLFSSVNSTASVQPILNQNENLGVTSQMVSFITEIITTLVLPLIICETFGFKYGLMLGQACHLCYVSSQLYPVWSTLIPTSVIAGFGNSICWTIIGVYVTILSKQYSKITNSSFVRIQTFFFAVCSSIFLTSYIYGAILVGAILNTEKENFDLVKKESYKVHHDNNITNSHEVYDYQASCGISNCPHTRLNHSLSKPTQASIYYLFIALISLIVASMLDTFFFMDNLSYYDDDESSPKEKITLSLIVKRFSKEASSLAKTYLNVDIWLMFPLTIYTGYELTFIWFELNRAFTTCLLGVNYVGWLNVLFGVLGSFLCLLFGYVLMNISAIPGIFFLLMTAFTVCIFMLTWIPNQAQAYVVILMVIGFAVSHSISNSQVRGLYGVYFPNNHSAFSAAALGFTTGLFLGSMVSTYFCTNVKVYIFVIVIVSSLVCFTILSNKHAIKKRKQNKIESKKELEPIMVF